MRWPRKDLIGESHWDSSPQGQPKGSEKRGWIINARSLSTYQRLEELPHQELYKYLHPLVIGALDRASSLSLMIWREILGYHLRDARKAERIARRLNYDYPAHPYPITAREVRRLGLAVGDLAEDVDELLHDLNLVY